MDKIFLFNAGHGGFVEGKYTTAPDKMHDFGNGKVAYEGLINRVIKDKVIEAVNQMGLPFIDVSPSNLDIPLRTRIGVINRYCNRYGPLNCILIDLHSNSGAGHGFEIYTSPGDTPADPFATRFVELFVLAFPDIKVRKDLCDGDPDKESSFYNLVKSKCPAILPEFLFFDNYYEFLQLMNPVIQDKYAAMIARFCLSISKL